MQLFLVPDIRVISSADVGGGAPTNEVLAWTELVRAHKELTPEHHRES